MIRSVLAATVSKGASVLDRIGEHLRDEEEEDDEEDELALQTEVEKKLKERNSKLRTMVRDLEEALAVEQKVSHETSVKLATKEAETRTIDDLVEEYSKLSSEAALQAEQDATKLAAALNRNEELATKVQAYEAQILSLTDRDTDEMRDLVKSGGSTDGARLFAALRAAKAKQFELELALHDARRGDEGVVVVKEDVPQQDEAMEALRLRAETAEATVSKLQGELATMESSLRLRAETAEATVLKLQGELRTMESSLRTMESSLTTMEAAHRGKMDLMEKSLDEKTAALADPTRMDRIRDEARAQAARSFEAQLAELRRERDAALEVAAEERTKRRDVHNKLVEARGNIRVYCRCRPTRDARGLSAVDFPNDGEIRVVREMDEAKFEFDGVFSPTSSQATVFDAVKDIVVSALDGFSVCIFAYGQTGSGKTWFVFFSPLSIFTFHIAGR